MTHANYKHVCHYYYTIVLFRNILLTIITIIVLLYYLKTSWLLSLLFFILLFFITIDYIIIVLPIFIISTVLYCHSICPAFLWRTAEDSSGGCGSNVCGAQRWSSARAQLRGFRGSDSRGSEDEYGGEDGGEYGGEWWVNDLLMKDFWRFYMVFMDVYGGDFKWRVQCLMILNDSLNCCLN